MPSKRSTARIPSTSPHDALKAVLDLRLADQSGTTWSLGEDQRRVIENSRARAKWRDEQAGFAAVGGVYE